MKNLLGIAIFCFLFAGSGWADSQNEFPAELAEKVKKVMCRHALEYQVDFQYSDSAHFNSSLDGITGLQTAKPETVDRLASLFFRDVAANGTHSPFDSIVKAGLRLSKPLGTKPMFSNSDWVLFENHKTRFPSVVRSQADYLRQDYVQKSAKRWANESKNEEWMKSCVLHQVKPAAGILAEPESGHAPATK